MKRARPLTPQERQRLADMRERLAICEAFGYKASSHELRRKIDALCKGRDLEALEKGL